MRTVSSLQGVLAALCAGFLIACSAAISRHDQQARSERGVYACGRWITRPMRAVRAIIDLDTDDAANESPEALAERVRIVGGRIVYLFHVGRVRAELDIRRAPALTGWFEEVIDTTRLDVPVMVGLRQPLPAADSTRLRRLGAQLSQRPFGHG